MSPYKNKQKILEITLIDMKKYILLCNIIYIDIILVHNVYVSVLLYANQLFCIQHFYQDPIIFERLT